MNYHIVTFGCQMNMSDSERISSVLKNIGYQPVLKINKADLIVINMCSVRQSPVDRIHGKINEINKLKNKGYKIKTLLTGCISKKDLKKFKKCFDYVLQIKSLNYWEDFLKKEKYSYYPNPREKEFNNELKANYLKIKPAYSKKFSVSIPISTGCNNFCTFCIVPYVRGLLIHRNHKEILKEIKESIKKGAKEIWLLGQNVNSYQSPTDSSINFPKLLKIVNEIDGNFWIRFTSSHPKDFSDKLIDIMADCEKVTEYLNLPVQAGDNEILKKMNRRYTIQQYKNLVKKIRIKIPNISLSTDAIVGFPGETKKQFQNTVKLFKEIKYDMAYISQYSPRSGTTAVEMKDSVSVEEKKRRKVVLTKILKQTALEKNKNYIGKEAEVLVDKMKNGFLTGKSRNYKTVKFEENQDLIGKLVKVKIIDALPWGLKGKLIK